MRRGVLESSIITQLGGSFRKIRDTWGVSKEAMAGIVLESWLVWDLDVEGDQVPRPPEADILAVHDAVTTKSRKAQQKLGKLVNQGRHAANKTPLDQLQETARPPGSADVVGGSETMTFAKARYRSLQGAKAIACLRARPTDLLRVIPASQFVGIGKSFMGIEEHVAVRCPCCKCGRRGHPTCTHLPQSRGAGDSHHPLLHEISRTLKRVGVPHQVERGEPFSADRDLRMDIMVRRGGHRDSQNREYREKSILLDVTYADLRGGGADDDASTASTSEGCKRQYYARTGHVSFDERSHKLAAFSGGEL